LNLNRRSVLALSAAQLIVPAAGAAAPIRIVAAENMYGDIARQIGGQLVTVSSILNNPNQASRMPTSSLSTAPITIPG
jgi:zinc/manganese transport system substrate-binding protein